MKMICDVPDEVIKSIKDGTYCGSFMVEKMIAKGIPLSSSENPTWKPNFRYGMRGEKMWICSKCDEQSMEHGRYCPHCGAKMREVE